jgi:hypothetical protein
METLHTAIIDLGSVRLQEAADCPRGLLHRKPIELVLDCFDLALAGICPCSREIAVGIPPTIDGHAVDTDRPRGGLWCLSSHEGLAERLFSRRAHLHGPAGYAFSGVSHLSHFRAPAGRIELLPRRARLLGLVRRAPR